MLSIRRRISEATSCLSESGRDSNSLRSCSAAIDIFISYYFNTDERLIFNRLMDHQNLRQGCSTVRCMLFDRSLMTTDIISNPRFTLPRSYLSRVTGIVPIHMTMPTLFGYRCSQRFSAVWTWRCHSQVPFRPAQVFYP
jgi:hypothetical protein